MQSEKDFNSPEAQMEALQEALQVEAEEHNVLSGWSLEEQLGGPNIVNLPSQTLDTDLSEEGFSVYDVKPYSNVVDFPTQEELEQMVTPEDLEAIADLTEFEQALINDPEMSEEEANYRKMMEVHPEPFNPKDIQSIVSAVAEKTAMNAANLPRPIYRLPEGDVPMITCVTASDQNIWALDQMAQISMEQVLVEGDPEGPGFGFILAVRFYTRIPYTDNMEIKSIGWTIPMSFSFSIFEAWLVQEIDDHYEKVQELKRKNAAEAKKLRKTPKLTH